MRMIERVMRSMRDTGLLDGMSDEDLDTVATAALEGMRESNDAMCFAGQRFIEKEIGSSATIQGVAYMTMIDAALNE